MVEAIEQDHCLYGAKSDWKDKRIKQRSVECDSSFEDFSSNGWQSLFECEADMI